MEFHDDQASSRVEFDDGTVLTKCDQCRQMWRERNERGIEGRPPCGTCKVELMPDNEDAARIYLLCRSQLIVVGGGMGKPYILDIMHEPIHRAMDLYAVKNKAQTFKLVLFTAHHFIKRQHDGEN